MLYANILILFVSHVTFDNIWFLLEETTSLEQTKGTENTNQSQEPIVNIVRLITVTAGSIISLVMLLIMIREIVRYRQLYIHT